MLLFVVFNYLLAKIVFKNEKLALFNMLLAALSPWTLFPSRGVFQSNLSQFFFIAGIYYFYKSLLKPKQAYLSAIFFGFSLLISQYSHCRPSLTLLLCHILLATIKKQTPSLFPLLFFILAVPNLLNLFSPESTARNRWVGIINPNSINLINEERRLYWTSNSKSGCQQQSGLFCLSALKKLCRLSQSLALILFKVQQTINLILQERVYSSLF